MSGRLARYLELLPFGDVVCVYARIEFLELANRNLIRSRDTVEGLATFDYVSLVLRRFRCWWSFYRDFRRSRGLGISADVEFLSDGDQRRVSDLIKFHQVTVSHFMTTSDRAHGIAQLYCISGNRCRSRGAVCSSESFSERGKLILNTDEFSLLSCDQRTEGRSRFGTRKGCWKQECCDEA